MPDYIPAKEVSRLVRAELKRAFPGRKFSVTTDRSIDVRWTDGPTQQAVEAVVGRFHGADFDGMDDMKVYNGRPYGNDFIFCHRSYSDAVMEETARMVCAVHHLSFDDLWTPPQEPAPGRSYRTLGTLLDIRVYGEAWLVNLWRHAMHTSEFSATVEVAP